MCIAVPEVLELDEFGNQSVELALVLGRRHQEQNAVQIALFVDDSLIAQ